MQNLNSSLIPHKNTLIAPCSILKGTHLIVFLLVVFSGCSLFSSNRQAGSSSLAKQADLAKNAGNCDTAIPLYRKHLRQRLKDEKRPKSENPWFYLILIGDCLMAQDKQNVAITVYLEAKEKKVLPELIADRFLRISEQMTAKNNFSEAMKFLKKYREIDELLFDARIDEIHKKMVAMEEFPIKDVEPIEGFQPEGGAF